MLDFVEQHLDMEFSLEAEMPLPHQIVLSNVPMCITWVQKVVKLQLCQHWDALQQDMISAQCGKV